jgi:hypothetical protein
LSCSRFVADSDTLNKAKYFDIVLLLQHICGHPTIFVGTLEERVKSRRQYLKLKQKGKQVAPVNGGEDGGFTEGDMDWDETDDAPEENGVLDTTEKPYSWAVPLLRSSGGDNIEHSYKMLAFRYMISSMFNGTGMLIN